MPAVPAHDTAMRRCVALLVAGALLPLAGCASEDDPSGDGGGGTSGGAASDVALDVKTAAREQIASGGSLRWAVDRMPRTLNAFEPDAGPATDRIAGATLPALFTLDSAARPRTNPDYVESAEVTQTKPQTVVYKLNPKAVWSTGRHIQLADFKAQWKALSGRHRAYGTARNAGYERIAKVTRGEDAHEVKVVFRKPYADWESLFTPLYPKSVMGGPGAFKRSAHRSLPASGGPFKARPFHAGDKSVTLVRNARWWGDRAKLKRVELSAMPRDRRRQALLAGKLDLADIDTPAATRVSGAHAAAAPKRRDGDAKAPGRAGRQHEPEDAAGTAPKEPHLSGTVDETGTPAGEHGSGARDRAAGEAGRDSEHLGTEHLTKAARKRAAEDRKLSRYTVRKAFAPAYTQLALNGAHGPLADERVRRAVARAIDRRALTKHALAGTGLPTEPLGSHLRMPGQDGYADNSGALGDRDVESAQSLLADAGWKDTPAAGSDGGEADAKKADGGAGGQDDKAEHKGSAGAGHGRSGGHERSVRTKGGKSLALRLVLPSGPGSRQIRATGERIASALNRIGVRTRAKLVPDETYLEDTIASGGYDLALYSWPGTAYPATDDGPVFAKPRAGADGSLRAGQNYTRVGTDQIDQLFKQASGELDDETRGDLIKRADARIWAAAGSVPLYQRPELVAMRNGLVNAGAFGFQTPRYQDIGYQR
jgi:peptide/nickel transport system substrate-binding protein